MKSTDAGKRVVRTTSRQRQPDFVRKAGPMDTSRRIRERQRKQELQDAIDEWADDMNGTHSIFED